MALGRERARRDPGLFNGLPGVPIGSVGGGLVAIAPSPETVVLVSTIPVLVDAVLLRADRARQGRAALAPLI
ncbi:MAG: hypothetical protein M1325_05545 [Actinobacteria bacterium]|nr:hypothetical protein [Actinomycetota bacterium]